MFMLLLSEETATPSVKVDVIRDSDGVEVWFIYIFGYSREDYYHSLLLKCLGVWFHKIYRFFREIFFYGITHDFR